MGRSGPVERATAAGRGEGSRVAGCHRPHPLPRVAAPDPGPDLLPTPQASGASSPGPASRTPSRGAARGRAGWADLGLRVTVSACRPVCLRPLWDCRQAGGAGGPRGADGRASRVEGALDQLAQQEAALGEGQPLGERGARDPRVQVAGAAGVDGAPGNEVGERGGAGPGPGPGREAAPQYRSRPRPGPCAPAPPCPRRPWAPFGLGLQASRPVPDVPGPCRPAPCPRPPPLRSTVPATPRLWCPCDAYGSRPVRPGLPGPRGLPPETPLTNRPAISASLRAVPPPVANSPLDSPLAPPSFRKSPDSTELPKRASPLVS